MAAFVVVTGTVKGTNSGFDTSTAVLITVIYWVIIVSIVWVLSHIERKRQKGP